MQAINQIIAKAIMDEEFREEFLQDPIKASEPFHLNPEEIAQLRTVELSELAQVNVELEERLSKSFINLPAIESNSAEHTSHGSNSSHSSTSHSSW